MPSPEEARSIFNDKVFDLWHRVNVCKIRLDNHRGEFLFIEKGRILQIKIQIRQQLFFSSPPFRRRAIMRSRCPPSPGHSSIED